MKIREAIERIDSLKHNVYSHSHKIAWLSRLDSMVQTLIIDAHAGETAAFGGYSDTTDPETELLVGAPFDEIYLRWLEAQMDYASGEYGRYNNAIAMFQAAFDGYANCYRRTHLPKKTAMKYF